MQRLPIFSQICRPFVTKILWQFVVIAAGAIVGTAVTKRFIEQSTFELPRFLCAAHQISIVVTILSCAPRTPVSMLG